MTMAHTYDSGGIHFDHAGKPPHRDCPRRCAHFQNFFFQVRQLLHGPHLPGEELTSIFRYKDPKK